jgi:hypothetical protein
MDLSKTLGLIENALREVPNLRKLRYDNAEYDLWCYKVVDILKAGFGPESDEYKRFAESVKPEKRTGTQWELQKWYNRRLTKRAAALLSIIRKYELLGKEGVYPEVGESQKSSVTHGEKTPKGKIQQLKQFLRELEKFRQLQIAAGDERLDPELDKLRTKLVRKSARMKELTLPHGGQLIFTQFNEDFDAFDTAFTKPIYPWGIATQWHAAVNCLIQKTNETIGKLKIMSPQDSLREAVYSSGTPYDAYKDIKEVISLATKKLIIVDPYVDSTVVTLLENVQPSVEIQVLTRHMQGDFELAVQKFTQQRNKAARGSVEVRQDKGDFHDRFIVADDNFFHLGASIKDAGTKVFAINEIEDSHNRSLLGENIREAWGAAAKVL